MSSKGDIIDQGNEAAELFQRAALSKRKPKGPEPTGFCLNCEAEVQLGMRWCDADCRTDWEKRTRAEAQRDADA